MNGAGRRIRPAVVAVTSLGLAGRASAHGGETTGLHDAPLSVALFLVGVVVVGASVYLDATRDPDRTYVDGAVFLGIAAALAGIATYWI